MPLALSVVTPARAVVETEVDTVVLPGAEGEFGVLPAHESLLAPLQQGLLTYRSGTQTRQIELGGGFAEVTATRVTVLADTASPR